MILTDLTKSGFFLLKKDRTELINQITELQSLLEDFEFAYPFLESIYEPKIILVKKDDKYFGQINILYPTAPEPVVIDFEIGKVSDYQNSNSTQLQSDMESKAEMRLKEKFPLHFEQ